MGEGSTSHCCFKLLLQNNLWKEIDSAKLLKVNRSQHIRGFTKITGQARDGDFPRFELKIKQLVKQLYEGKKALVSAQQVMHLVVDHLIGAVVAPGGVWAEIKQMQKISL